MNSLVRPSDEGYYLTHSGSSFQQIIGNLHPECFFQEDFEIDR